MNLAHRQTHRLGSRVEATRKKIQRFAQASRCYRQRRDDDDGISDPLLTWSQDASRRDAAEFFSALKISRKHVTIQTFWAAHDTSVKIVAGMAGGVVPRLVGGHRAFDAKEALIVVGNDEKERRRRIGADRARFSNKS
jgi:hypothetical protein